MNNTAYLISLAMLFGYGLFQLVGGIFDVPSHREIKTIMAVGKKKKEKVNFLDAFIFKVSHLILPYVRLNPYKHKKMSNALKSLGSLDTP
jgi:tight adherence protein C